MTVVNYTRHLELRMLGWELVVHSNDKFSCDRNYNDQGERGFCYFERLSRGNSAFVLRLQQVRMLAVSRKLVKPKGSGWKIFMGKMWGINFGFTLKNLSERNRERL